MDRVQAAIIATPHHLHSPLTLEFISRGIHVLSEKPLAESASDVDKIVSAAKSNRVHVAVNHTRRLFSSCQAIQRAIRGGAIGELKEIDYVLGEPFAWPAATDTYFGKRSGGKGVLFDTGAHIIDLVCWWMGGEPRVVAYADDSSGGTEAVADVTLEYGGATAHVRLSWLSKLENRFRITGTKGVIEGGVYEWSAYDQRIGSGALHKIKTDGHRVFTDFADMLLKNFTDVIAGTATPIVAAADVRAAVATIDACYARRSKLPEPWHDACARLTHV